jgi:hypothetical protein
MLKSLVLSFALLSTGGSAAEPVVTYDRDIKPIFREHCMKCHGEDDPKAGLNLSTHETALKGGSAGAVLVAGRASASLLFKAITDADEDKRMPLRNPPLRPDKIELIRVWIQAGLRESAESKSLAAVRDTGYKPVVATVLDGPPPMPENLPAFTPPATKRPLPIIAMAASPTAPLLAVAGHEHVRLIDLNTEQPLGALSFPEGQPNVIRFSRDGRVLMIAGGKPVQSGSVVLYDVRSGKRLARVGDETDAVLSADLSPDQKLVALGGTGKVVKVYDTADGKLRYKLTRHTDWITGLAFSPDGQVLASADRAGAIHLWDATSGGILFTLAEHKAAVRALSWRADSRMLASGGEDGLLVWWDCKDGWPVILKNDAHPPTRPKGYYGKIPNGVLSVAFGPAGELLTAGRDGKVRLWNATGDAQQSFPIETALPLQAAIKSDGKTYVAGDASGELHYWSEKPVISLGSVSK